MRKKNLFLFALLVLLPLSLAQGQGGGNGSAMTPVGAWNFTAMDLDGNTLFTVLAVFNFGGTTTQSANNGPEITGYGTWEADGGREFRFSQYLPIFDPGFRSPSRQSFDDGVHVGHVLVLGDMFMDGKDNMSGTAELYVLIGTDPLRPESSFPIPSQILVGERLPLAPPQ